VHDGFADCQGWVWQGRRPNYVNKITLITRRPWTSKKNGVIPFGRPTKNDVIPFGRPTKNDVIAGQHGRTTKPPIVHSSPTWKWTIILSIYVYLLVSMAGCSYCRSASDSLDVKGKGMLVLPKM